jgi:RAP1 GTPase activating protein 1
MYHVAPMIPNPSIDKQQLDRKRHLGNDIVVLLFRDAVRLSENLHPPF